MRKFEYDPNKSAANQEKYGIDFEAAQALWEDQRLLTVKAKTTDEERYVR
nr:BrnT family toxin [Pseudomaricurvus alkylphenolicus]